MLWGAARSWHRPVGRHACCPACWGVHLCAPYTHLLVTVPGYHWRWRGSELQPSDQWGHLRMRQLLQQESFPAAFKGAPIAAQFTSMGRIDDRWWGLGVAWCGGAGHLHGMARPLLCGTVECMFWHLHISMRPKLAPCCLPPCQGSLQSSVPA